MSQQCELDKTDFGFEKYRIVTFTRLFYFIPNKSIRCPRFINSLLSQFLLYHSWNSLQMRLDCYEFEASRDPRSCSVVIAIVPIFTYFLHRTVTHNCQTNCVNILSTLWRPPNNGHCPIEVFRPSRDLLSRGTVWRRHLDWSHRELNKVNWLRFKCYEEIPHIIETVEIVFLHKMSVQYCTNRFQNF